MWAQTIGGAAHGPAAPPYALGAPPFASFSSRTPSSRKPTERTSRRVTAASAGRRTPERKELSGGREGEILPEGEIDAIAIVIERDIISIIIIIISTIYTAITTAAPLNPLSKSTPSLLVGIDILTYRRYYDTPLYLWVIKTIFAPLPGSEALLQHLENSESEAFRKERDELEEIFLRQPILKHDLPVEDLEIEEERLLEILKKHRGAIGYTLDDLKGISPSICQHAINMEEDAKPVVEHQRRLIPKMKEVVRNEVLKLLEAGIIYPIADSRWVSPVHCVPKKGGMTVVPNDNDELIPQRIVVGYRMCIDFRKVNKVTKKDHYPLPFIDQMLERLSKNTHFCFLDGYSGFSQIVVKAKDQEKTTFTCPYGTYAYRRMPFGLCNAPATFQRCMSAIFHGFCESIVEVFMDDFSVYGNSFDNCLRNLDKVLQRCEETNLVLNWEKCHFMVNEGIVLGHKISERGIEVDRAKVEAIEKMPYPRDVKDRKGADNPVADNLSRLENIAYDPVPVNDSFPNEQLAVIKVSSRESPCTMASNNKDKEPLKENIQDPELKKEDARDDEEEVEEAPQEHQQATVASIGVISNPSDVKRSARITTGGAVPRHYLAPRTSSPSHYNPYRNLIYDRQTERTPKVVLPSNWDINRSDNAGEMKSEAEGWGNNSKSWDSPPDMIMSRVEHNSEMIRNLTYEIEGLQELVRKLVEKNPSPSSPKE
ncbi:hypothetical protein QYE76_058889 [Lolium multiflorum]|uniref:Reverse transcriptase domain-containing protein n=1 Tax=Lolium multiflorum TaxID=4521 RepID=A0AAD8T7A6_LOLMU|nr:hypothetical protein QYE76_058889 [Lolium multiflorum]